MSNITGMARLRTLVFYLAVALVVLVILLPFIWQLRTSFLPPDQINKMPPDWVPHKWFVTYYINVFTVRPFVTYLKNSLIVSTATMVANLTVGSLAAYALARLRLPFKRVILALVLTVSMFPGVSIISPLFLIMKSLHLLNSYTGLVLPYTTFALPLSIWMMTSFFREIPLELEESAKMDGCTPMQTFGRIMLPLAAPGLFTAAILVFIQAWNEFLLSLTFNTADKMRTVPVGIAMFPGQYTLPWGDVAAASIVVTVPLIVLVLIFQRRIIAGLTAGAVKG